MRQYHELLRHVREHGARKTDRTGTGTLSVFGYQMRFDLRAGFPLVTTKKIHLKSAVHVAVVFAWRYEHRLSARAWRDHLG